MASLDRVKVLVLGDSGNKYKLNNQSTFISVTYNENVHLKCKRVV